MVHLHLSMGESRSFAFKVLFDGFVVIDDFLGCCSNCLVLTKPLLVLFRGLLGGHD